MDSAKSRLLDSQPKTRYGTQGANNVKTPTDLNSNANLSQSSETIPQIIHPGHNGFFPLLAGTGAEVTPLSISSQINLGLDSEINKSGIRRRVVSSSEMSFSSSQLTGKKSTDRLTGSSGDSDGSPPVLQRAGNQKRDTSLGEYIGGSPKVSPKVSPRTDLMISTKKKQNPENTSPDISPTEQRKNPFEAGKRKEHLKLQEAGKGSTAGTGNSPRTPTMFSSDLRSSTEDSPRTKIVLPGSLSKSAEQSPRFPGNLSKSREQSPRFSSSPGKSTDQSPRSSGNLSKSAEQSPRFSGNLSKSTEQLIDQKIFGQNTEDSYSIQELDEIPQALPDQSKMEAHEIAKKENEMLAMNQRNSWEKQFATTEVHSNQGSDVQEINESPRGHISVDLGQSTHNQDIFVDPPVELDESKVPLQVRREQLQEEEHIDNSCCCSNFPAAISCLSRHARNFGEVTLRLSATVALTTFLREFLRGILNGLSLNYYAGFSLSVFTVSWAVSWNLIGLITDSCAGKDMGLALNKCFHSFKEAIQLQVNHGNLEISDQDLEQLFVNIKRQLFDITEVGHGFDQQTVEACLSEADLGTKYLSIEDIAKIASTTKGIFKKLEGELKETWWDTKLTTAIRLWNVVTLSIATGIAYRMDRLSALGVTLFCLAFAYTGARDLIQSFYHLGDNVEQYKVFPTFISGIIYGFNQMAVNIAMYYTTGSLEIVGGTMGHEGLTELTRISFEKAFCNLLGEIGDTKTLCATHKAYEWIQALRHNKPYKPLETSGKFNPSWVSLAKTFTGPHAGRAWLFACAIILADIIETKYKYDQITMALITGAIFAAGYCFLLALVFGKDFGLTHGVGGK